MRGISLAKLTSELRAEIGHSTNVALGVNSKASLTQTIIRNQNRLWEEYDWSHMRVYRTIPLAAGQRYYSVPSDLYFERITDVWVRYAGSWIPLLYPIEELDYTAWDSDNDERSWPVRKWEHSEITPTSPQAMIELWPIPSNDASTTSTDGHIRFRGIKNLSAFAQDGDLCEIDGTLLVLMSAAELLARQKMSDAPVKQAQAQQLLSKLMSQNSKKRRYVSYTENDRYGVPGSAYINYVPATIRRP